MPKVDISKTVPRIVCESRIFGALSMRGKHNAMCLIMRALCLWRRLNATITISTFLAMYLLPIRRFCKISMHTFMEACPNTI